MYLVTSHPTKQREGEIKGTCYHCSGTAKELLLVTADILHLLEKIFILFGFYFIFGFFVLTSGTFPVSWFPELTEKGGIHP